MFSERVEDVGVSRSRGMSVFILLMLLFSSVDVCVSGDCATDEFFVCAGVLLSSVPVNDLRVSVCACADAADADICDVGVSVDMLSFV